jgi:hypothetical protein
MLGIRCGVMCSFGIFRTCKIRSRVASKFHKCPFSSKQKKASCNERIELWPSFAENKIYFFHLLRKELLRAFL